MYHQYGTSYFSILATDKQRAEILDTCDKWKAIVEKIREDAENGKRSFLIVPEQQTVVSERILASSLPAGAQLITEVVNFTRLSNEVFRKVGGLKYNYITKQK